ncbi:MAG: Type 1 glutamine amidotransferase-like domain-containing protein [Chloroflexi bacterium]|nr:Type 1 glutamine amidotransferase-like domain-containing protein [Chloroflexota bacterium]
MIALIGGNEFRENCREMDRALLARLGTSARVLVIPTAAANESPRQAANNGVAHLKRLGAKAEPLYVIQRDHAQADEMVAAIREAKGVYFSGGDPVHLLETLRGTKVWRAVVELSERGGLVAGSSAGAMVMGGQMWTPGAGAGWREGLGLVPGLAVIPHHATVATRWNAAKMRESLAPEVTLVGIDEATAVLFPDHLVLGEGEVTVYTSEPKTYASGKLVAEKLD